MLADYSYARPSLDLIKSLGCDGVIRYLSHTASKDISDAEARELLKAGLSITLVWELTANRALAGEAAGETDRREAEFRANQLGYPPSAVIFMAVDFDATPTQVEPYLRGASKAAQRPRGVYGGVKIINAFVGGLADYGWQTKAWSFGVISSKAHLYQRVFEQDYDLNDVRRPFPRWKGLSVATSLIPAGVLANVKQVCAELVAEFPTITHVWGYNTVPDHNNRRCIDYMVVNSEAVANLPRDEQVKLGDSIAAYNWANRSRLGLELQIWNRRIQRNYDKVLGDGTFVKAGTWVAYTGPNPHTDHVHAQYKEQTYIPPKETDVALSDADVTKIVDTLMKRDGLIPNTFRNAEDNPQVALKTALAYLGEDTKRIEKKLDALIAKLGES